MASDPPVQQSSSKTVSSYRPAPSGPGTRAGIRPAWIVPGVLIALVVALFLRGKNLDGARLLADETAALHQANALELEGTINPARWVREDFWWLARIHDENRTAASPTGPLHGVLTRVFVRAGQGLGFKFSRVAAVRLDAVLFGALTVLLLVLILRRVAPAEPLVALAGGGLAAVQLGAVLVARTGTGETGAAFFVLAMFATGWWMYRTAGEHQLGRLFAGALGLALTSLLAYGFDSQSILYPATLGVLVLLLFRTSPPDDASKWPWFSRRVLFGLLGLVPVLIVNTSGLLDGASAADAPGALLALRAVSVPVLLFALIGLGGALTRDATWLIWLIMWIALPIALFQVMTPGGGTLGNFLPVLYALVLLGAEGMGALWTISRTRVSGAFSDAAIVGAVLWCAAVTWTTVFGAPSSQLFVHEAHGDLPANAGPMETFYDIQASVDQVRATDPDASVEVILDEGPRFRLADRGIEAAYSSTLDGLAQQARTSSMLIVPREAMEDERARLVQSHGGPWVMKAQDRHRRLGLYVRSQ